MVKFTSVLIVAFGLSVACAPQSAGAYQDSRSAAQIASDASAALKSAHSAHVVFVGTDQGAAIAADLDVEGANAKGTLSAQGITYHVMLVNGNTFIPGADLVALARLTSPQIADLLAPQVTGKWVLVPSIGPVNQEDLGVLANINAMADCLQSDKGLAKRNTTVIAGDTVVEVADSQGGRLFVDVKSPHDPRRVVLGAGRQCVGGPSGINATGTVDFSNLGSHFGIAAPQDSIDLSSLGVNVG